jgi:hypothetical protein
MMNNINWIFYQSKEFEDIKGVTGSRKWEDRKYNDQRKRTKGQTMIYKTLHRKLKIEARKV